MSASSIYYRSLRALGVAAVARQWQDAGRILCYHNVVAEDEAGIGGAGLHMPREKFERQMRWLKDYFSIIPLSEFVTRLHRGASLRSTAAIAFDDGYNGVFEHAGPILQELRIPATVFVVADAAGRSRGFWWDRVEVIAATTKKRHERWLTDLRGDESAIRAEVPSTYEYMLPFAFRAAGWDRICQWLERGLEIGVHSASHRSLPTLTDVELDQEVKTSRDVIANATGTRPQCFAYPYGRCDSRVRDRVQAAGYQAALGLHSGVTAAGADAWQLDRINIPAGISDAAFEAWTSGLQARRTC